WARATARHFTWWNADYPIESHTCVKARFVRATDGTPLGQLDMEAQGVTYAGQSPARFTGFDTADGVTACFTVKRSEQQVESVVIAVIDASGRRYLQLQPGGEYAVVDDLAAATPFPTPAVNASCLWNVNTEDCADLGTLRLDANSAPVITATL